MNTWDKVNQMTLDLVTENQYVLGQYCTKFGTNDYLALYAYGMII